MERDMEEKTEQIVEKFFQFLGVMFGKNGMTDIEAQERLYLIQYMRTVLNCCLEAQEMGQIPILEMTVWATYDGKTNVTINPSKNKQTLESWELSKLTKHLMDVINAWDKEDIGRKEGKIIDMMSKLGWIKDK